MSLILDALRKSEAERRLGTLPALALELPPAHARALPRRAAWMLLPAALLAAAATAWLVRRDAQPPATAVAPPVPTPLVVDAGPQPPRRTLPVREAPPEPLWEPPRRRTAREELAAVAAPTGQPEAAPEPVVEPVPVPLADLPADERRALPPLELSMHLWAQDPARRFVILDGRRLGEGDLAGNALVERIDPEGVILAVDGRRIRLPLP